ncbi:DUF960 domain-containing protein [Paenibacillus alkaliterrae]|uniref:DUF960 family protein n=1 Tax=Paenibacillus alkaliterrae TaxID=320909 RepID=UPI001F18A37C|nr:DUF960 family protein [Paenibacillus alkaliterrae]MCF2939933.1 DUF960 domain-containing protein [Paenibacillus alkaliterrae]
MFPKHSRYKTRGIDENVSEPLQLLMWQLIDRDLDECVTFDYLQVFELFAGYVDGKPVQHICHRQEQPKRSRLHTISGIDKSLTKLKVWVIDSGTYCTMLLPEEY